jgi:DNA repair ATPase RecN
MSIKKFISTTVFLALFCAGSIPSFAHSNGCHGWHSCPPDDGSYVCGDTGHFNYCQKVELKTTEPAATPKTTPASAIVKPKIKKVANVSGIVQKIKTTNQKLKTAKKQLDKAVESITKLSKLDSKYQALLNKVDTKSIEEKINKIDENNLELEALDPSEIEKITALNKENNTLLNQIKLEIAKIKNELNKGVK